MYETIAICLMYFQLFYKYGKTVIQIPHLPLLQFRIIQFTRFFVTIIMIVDIVRIGLILNAFRILEAGTDIQQRNVSQENSNVLLLHKSDMEYVSDSMLVPVKSRKYEQKRNISSLWDFLRRKCKSIKLQKLFIFFFFLPFAFF